MMSTPDLTPVYAMVEGQDDARLREICDQLKALGLEDARIGKHSGIISGRATPANLARLREYGKQRSINIMADYKTVH